MQRDALYYPATQRDKMLHAGPGWVWDEYFIARLEQGMEEAVEPMHTTVGDNYFVLALDRYAVCGMALGNYGLTKLGYACRCDVMGLVVPQGPADCLFYVLGDAEARLAALE